LTRSGENGTRRMRTPVASKIAFAIAAATGRIEGSPAPEQLGMVDQHHLDRLRRLGDVEDRIGHPVDAGHVLSVELDLLPSRTAHALDDVALDGVPGPFGVDDLAAVMSDGELARPEFSARALV